MLRRGVARGVSLRKQGFLRLMVFVKSAKRIA